MRVPSSASARLSGCRPVTETIHVREFNPLDGGIGFKSLAEDVGLVVDGPFELMRYHVTGKDDD